jgi:hypothetical protein
MACRRLPLLLAAGCAITLAGCSGTPFGDQLARSFSGAPSGAQSPGAAKSPDSAKATDTATATNGNPAAATDSAKPAQAKSPANQAPPARTQLPAPKPLPLPRPPAPADYRVTIKLPSVDPSAPAEALTKALRSAGLSFEVETIERVRPGSGTQGATVTPAPPPR